MNKTTAKRRFADMPRNYAGLCARCLPRPILSAIGLLALVGVGSGAAVAKVWEITNGDVSICYDEQTREISASWGKGASLRGGSLGGFLHSSSPPKVKVVKSARDQCLVISEAAGRQALLSVVKGQPFVYLTPIIANRTGAALYLERLTVFSARADLGMPLEKLRVLGYDGLGPATQPKTTYLAISLAEPESLTGLVCGWLTHHRASGLVSLRPEQGQMVVEARSDYGRMLVPPAKARGVHRRGSAHLPVQDLPGDAVIGETLALGCVSNIFEGLESYANELARRHQRKPQPVPCGYMTWYHARALDEKRMPALAQWCAANLKPYGFQCLQIDDGWQVSRRDFTTHNPKPGYPDTMKFTGEAFTDAGPYPNGMKATADAIARHGLTPGIWLTPFGWDHQRPVFANHQDWFARKPDGSVYAVTWGGDCLDMSHPDARRFLREVIERSARQWGYRFFKLDALWAGLAAGLLYPEPQYREDGFGDARFYDPEVSNVQALRMGLTTCREAAGPGAYLLGCTISQNMRTLGGSIGLVDAMRVGIDSGGEWKGLVANVISSVSLYYLHGRVWHNDADVLYLDKSFSLDEVRSWASWLSLSGNLLLVSSWLPEVPPERLEALKRAMPNHHRQARPVDLFESCPAQVWHLSSGQGEARRDVLGLFNWEQHPQRLGVDLRRLAPDATATNRFVGFDFWENRFIRPFSGPLAAEVKPHACRVLAVQHELDRPQLISTSRHITQGIVDLVSSGWDARKSTLHGVSRVVGGDAYELRVLCPEDRPWRVRRAEISRPDRRVAAGQSGVGVTVEWQQDGPEIRVRLSSPQNRTVAWRISFE